MITIIKQHIRSIILLLLILILSACTEPGPAVVPGVSLELAQYRASRIENINYKLALVIPEATEAGITGKVSVSFDLAGNTAPLQLDFRENADNISRVVANGTAS